MNDQLRQHGGHADGRARLLAIVLVLLAIVGVPAIIAAGDGLEPQPEVAGRYEVQAGDSCIGAAFDLQQSGEYLLITHPNGDEIGRPRLADGRATGTLECLSGDQRELDAEIAGTRMAGRLGAEPLEALRVRTAEQGGDAALADPANVGGEYVLAPESVCLGRQITIADGDRPTIELADGTMDELRYSDGELSGDTQCLDGDVAGVLGVPTADRLELEIRRRAPAPGEPSVETAIAEHEESLGERTAAFFLAAFVILIVARLIGAASAALKQPRVMGEILAGILLGPTLLGWVAPEIHSELFSASVLEVLGVVANIGVAFYIFTVGAELDLRGLRGRGTQVLAISAASLFLPLLLGTGAGLFLFEPLSPDTSFGSFALFLGVALSITAFPVLARILEERGMSGGTLGTTALTCAAIGDLVGWLLVTLAAALAAAGMTEDVVETLLLTAGFLAVMVLVNRPLLAAMGRLYDRVPDDPGAIPNRTGLLGFVFAGVLLAAWATEEIGIALIIGALAQGAALPRNTQMTRDAAERLATPITVLLLPLFFAYAGLRADVGLLGEAELWLIAGGLLALAIVGKLVGGSIAARVAGFGRRDSLVLGTLLNTRGLTELIILTVGLEIGVISDALYTALVLMALITTFMAGPLLQVLQRPRHSEVQPVSAS